MSGAPTLSSLVDRLVPGWCSHPLTLRTAVYSIFTSPHHPPVPEHLPTLIVTPHGRPQQVLCESLASLPPAPRLPNDRGADPPHARLQTPSCTLCGTFDPRRARTSADPPSRSRFAERQHRELPPHPSPGRRPLRRQTVPSRPLWLPARRQRRRRREQQRAWRADGGPERALRGGEGARLARCADGDPGALAVPRLASEKHN